MVGGLPIGPPRRSETRVEERDATVQPQPPDAPVDVERQTDSHGRLFVGWRGWPVNRSATAVSDEQTLPRCQPVPWVEPLLG